MSGLADHQGRRLSANVRSGSFRLVGFGAWSGPGECPSAAATITELNDPKADLYCAGLPCCSDAWGGGGGAASGGWSIS